MLRNVKDLRGYAIHATDGVIGKVDDIYFDDEDWGVRYLIVETGSWLSSKKVLISPIAVGHAGWMARRLPVVLTRAQVKGSPDIDTRKPVSRQQETEYLAYYGYPFYWGGWLPSGNGYIPGQRTDQAEQSTDCHLRSCNAVIGHRVEATDGHVGHIDDMLVDDSTWGIRYLIVRTSSWGRGEELLVPPHWIEKVSWPEKQVLVDRPRHSVREAPRYTLEARGAIPRKKSRRSPTIVTRG